MHVDVDVDRMVLLYSLPVSMPVPIDAAQAGERMGMWMEMG